MGGKFFRDPYYLGPCPVAQSVDSDTELAQVRIPRGADRILSPSLSPPPIIELWAQGRYKEKSCGLIPEESCGLILWRRRVWGKSQRHITLQRDAHGKLL